MRRATHRLHVSIGVRSCRWIVNCRDAVPFGCCRRLCVAVSRGSPLTESDGRFAWFAETVVAHVGLVMLPSGATPQRHDLRQCVVTSVSVFTVYWDDVVSYVHFARGPCMLFVCLVHVRVWLCVRCTVFGTLTLIIVSFGSSFRPCVARCGLCPLYVLMSLVQCICETLATKLYF